MTWNAQKTKEPEEVKWVPAKEIVHEQGLKILVWGDAEVGKGLNRNGFLEKKKISPFLFFRAFNSP